MNPKQNILKRLNIMLQLIVQLAAPLLSETSAIESRLQTKFDECAAQMDNEQNTEFSLNGTEAIILQGVNNQDSMSIEKIWWVNKDEIRFNAKLVDAGVQYDIIDAEINVQARTVYLSKPLKLLSSGRNGYDFEGSSDYYAIGTIKWGTGSNSEQITFVFGGRVGENPKALAMNRSLCYDHGEVKFAKFGNIVIGAFKDSDKKNSWLSRGNNDLIFFGFITVNDVVCANIFKPNYNKNVKNIIEKRIVETKICDEPAKFGAYCTCPNGDIYQIKEGECLKGRSSRNLNDGPLAPEFKIQKNKVSCGRITNWNYGRQKSPYLGFQVFSDKTCWVTNTPDAIVQCQDYSYTGTQTLRAANDFESNANMLINGNHVCYPDCKVLNEIVNGIHLCVDKCSAGYGMRGSDLETCVVCNYGEFTQQDQNQIIRCVECSHGNILNKERNGCLECRKNQITNIDKSACIQCKGDTVPNITQSECIVCGTNEIPNDINETCRPCGTNQTVSTDRISCVDIITAVVPTATNSEVICDTKNMYETCVRYQTCESGKILTSTPFANPSPSDACVDSCSDVNKEQTTIVNPDGGANVNVCLDTDNECIAYNYDGISNQGSQSPNQGDVMLDEEGTNIDAFAHQICIDISTGLVKGYSIAKFDNNMKYEIVGKLVNDASDFNMLINLSFIKGQPALCDSQNWNIDSCGVDDNGDYTHCDGTDTPKKCDSGNNRCETCDFSDDDVTCPRLYKKPITRHNHSLGNSNICFRPMNYVAPLSFKCKVKLTVYLGEYTVCTVCCLDQEDGYDCPDDRQFKLCPSDPITIQNGRRLRNRRVLAADNSQSKVVMMKNHEHGFGFIVGNSGAPKLFDALVSEAVVEAKILDPETGLEGTLQMEFQSLPDGKIDVVSKETYVDENGISKVIDANYAMNVSQWDNFLTKVVGSNDQFRIQKTPPPQKVEKVQVAPVQVAPVQFVPVQVAPVQVYPQQAYQQQVYPQQVSPQQVSPQQVSPQQDSPQQVSPQQVTPVQQQPAPSQQSPTPTGVQNTQNQTESQPPTVWDATVSMTSILIICIIIFCYLLLPWLIIYILHIKYKNYTSDLDGCCQFIGKLNCLENVLLITLCPWITAVWACFTYSNRHDKVVPVINLISERREISEDNNPEDNYNYKTKPPRKDSLEVVQTDHLYNNNTKNAKGDSVHINNMMENINCKDGNPNRNMTEPNFNIVQVNRNPNIENRNASIEKNELVQEKKPITRVSDQQREGEGSTFQEFTGDIKNKNHS